MFRLFEANEIKSIVWIGCAIAHARLGIWATCEGVRAGVIDQLSPVADHDRRKRGPGTRLGQNE